MRRMMKYTLAAVTLAVLVGFGAMATPASAAARTTSGMNGTFSGRVSGSDDSSAPLTVTLSKSGKTITGTGTIGTGLVASAGWCGTYNIPARSYTGSATIDPTNPNHVSWSSTFETGGVSIPVTMVGDLSADGTTITAQAIVDIPMFCGADPSFPATLTRTK